MASKTKITAGNTIEADGFHVSVTNLDKVYWPEEGFLKFDLLNYYINVSDAIMPYLLHRPQVLRRHPDGVDGEGFFQKDVKGEAPDWAATIDIEAKSSGRETTYLVCENLATLLFMVNLGCIEINPWNARVADLEAPDYAILDLDPGNKTTFEDVITTALTVRELLEKADIPSFCKTSGSRGMHVLIPLGAKYSHEQARDFAKSISLLVHKKLPGLTSLKRSPKERRRQIYLDYLQNKIGATLVAPYSARPRPGATVSAPLEWKEVKPGLEPIRFTIKTMPERLAKKGDLLEGLLGEGIDMLASLERLMKVDG